MILGISGSPRANGITAHAVKEVLAHSEGETKYISLAGKHINGCISCLGCTTDNKCIVQDDFQEIAKVVKESCPVSKALSGVDIELEATLG